MEPEAIKALAAAASGSESIWVTGLAVTFGALIVAHRLGLLSFLRDKTSVQSEGFQDRLLKALDASEAREASLGCKIDALDDENHKLREEVAQGRFEVHMLRRQFRLLLEGLRLVKDGQLSLDHLQIPELDPGAG